MTRVTPADSRLEPRHRKPTNAARRGFLFLTLALAACSPGDVNAIAGEYSLKTMIEPGHGVPMMCAGIRFDPATLGGAPGEPATTWLQFPDGNEVEVFWPTGYRARFNPTLEVLDPARRVVARGGDVFSDACTAPGGVYIMSPR
jgi:hypothetical protein